MNALAEPPAERTRLSELTTLRVGGPARRVVQGSTEEEILEVVRAADADGDPLLVVGSGSNLLVADEGFDGTALRILSAGVSAQPDGGGVRLTVAAGQVWDEFVAKCVSEGYAGVECLSGIPGLTGATPIQNVGAYGQEVAETIVCVRTFDRDRSEIVELAPEQCGFGYRSSAFKRSSRHVVLGVTFALERSATARPIRYPELARALGVAVGDRPPLAPVREAVISLRRSKGMVLDPEDPDTTSAGSFFLNPVISPEDFVELQRIVRRRLGEEVKPPAWPQGDGGVKLSAAWLIERAGFSRGYGAGEAGISTKHTLALVNRGAATAAELVALARELRDGVRATFGVSLEPEPTLVGVEL